MLCLEISIYLSSILKCMGIIKTKFSLVFVFGELGRGMSPGSGGTHDISIVWMFYPLRWAVGVHMFYNITLSSFFVSLQYFMTA